MGENKNSHRKMTVNHTQATCKNCIALRLGKKYIKCYLRIKLRKQITFWELYAVKQLKQTKLLQIDRISTLNNP